ncbi:hypothetical protein M422DRAFT_245962 [Sphaerobolus stellatus SS14]|nr:hypothetical protein M422DRAFT_245962 [Sphaerobolus stellatus SS14]
MESDVTMDDVSMLLNSNGAPLGTGYFSDTTTGDAQAPNMQANTQVANRGIQHLDPGMIVHEPQMMPSIPDYNAPVTSEYGPQQSAAGTDLVLYDRAVAQGDQALERAQLVQNPGQGVSDRGTCFPSDYLLNISPDAHMLDSAGQPEIEILRGVASNNIPVFDATTQTPVLQRQPDIVLEGMGTITINHIPSPGPVHSLGNPTTAVPLKADPPMFSVHSPASSSQQPGMQGFIPINNRPGGSSLEPTALSIM